MQLSIKLICVVLLGYALCSAVNAGEKCNKDNHFSAYINEWLANNQVERTKVRELLKVQMSNVGDRLDPIIDLYRAFFKGRAAPLLEIKQCDIVQIVRELTDHLK